ncbi:MAG: DUF1922 domain-containing protein [Candidatus Heimdallarchaeaceae archaeon]
MIKRYAVIRCRNLSCGKFTYCKSSQKTKMCTYCGKRIVLKKTKIIYTETPEQARKLVQELNKRLGELTEPSWYNPEK